MQHSTARNDIDLLRTIDDGFLAIAVASSEILSAITEFDHKDLFHVYGATSMSAWLAARYHLTKASAVEWVRIGRALRSLPCIDTVYREGKLSWDQLRPLTKFATSETDEHWAKEAPSWRAVELWGESRRYEQVRREESEDTHRSRYHGMQWNEDRTELSYWGRYGAEQGQAYERAVSERSQTVVVADDPYDPAGARQADAVFELVTENSGEPAPANLVVHADASVLTGEERKTGPWLAETEEGTRLCSESIRRLACDGRIEWVLQSEGRTVGIGRRGRTVPGSVMRALKFRDRGCRFLGCERQRWLKAHHIVHWARGGPTDLDNLVLLCHAHHRLVHEGGWRISGYPDEELRFHDPTGKPLRTYWQGELLQGVAQAASVDSRTASVAG
jgi:hypothetical protein